MIYIVLDESGLFNESKNKYFVIAGYITDNVHKIRTIHKKIERQIRMKNKRYKNVIELKSTELYASERALFLNGLLSIKNVYPIAIYYDLSKEKNLLKRCKTSQDKYDFLIKVLINEIFDDNKDWNSLNMSDKNLTIIMDQRKVDITEHTGDLDEYLQNHCNIFRDVKLSCFKRVDSKFNREVQMADYISNSLWAKFNYPMTEKVFKKLNNWNEKFIFNYPKDTKFLMKKKNQEIKKIRQQTININDDHVTLSTHVMHIRNNEWENKLSLFKKSTKIEHIESFYKEYKKFAVTKYKNGKVLVQSKKEHFLNLQKLLNINLNNFDTEV